MTASRNFLFKVTLSQNKVKKNFPFASGTIEIIPQLPGCMIIPQSIKLEDSYSGDICFFVTPINQEKKISSELLVNRNFIIKKFSIPCNIVTTIIPKMCVASGVVAFLIFTLYDIFDFSFKVISCLF